MSEIKGGDAPQAPVPPVRRTRSAMPRSFHFSMGEALSRTLACFGKNLPVLLVFGLVLFVPLILLQLGAGKAAWTKAAADGDQWLNLGDAFWWHFAQESGAPARLLGWGLPWFLQAILTLGVFQFLRGQGMQAGRSFGRGMERFFPVLGIALLTVILMFLAMIPAGLVIGMVATAGGMVGLVIAALLGLSVVFAITCIFFVSVQSAIVERIGPFRAMSRSAALTKGARWKIFGIILIFGVLGYAIQHVVQTLFVGDDPTSWSQARNAIIASIFVTSVFAVLQAVAATVVYHDLRRAKEGVDIDELMSVFA